MLCPPLWESKCGTASDAVVSAFTASSTRYGEPGDGVQLWMIVPLTSTLSPHAGRANTLRCRMTNIQSRQFPHRSRQICSPTVQETRGARACTGTMPGSGAMLAISSTSLVRIASLN